MSDNIVSVESEWYLSLSGWPLWLALPVGMLLCWCMYRLYVKDVSSCPVVYSKRLMALRMSVVCLLLLLLLEPSLRRELRVKQLPVIDIMIDGSGSMGIVDNNMTSHDLLNEAEGLGLLQEGVRDTSCREGAEILSRVLKLIPDIAVFLSPGGGQDENVLGEKRRGAILENCKKYAAELDRVRPPLSGYPKSLEIIESTSRIVARVIGYFEGDKDRSSAKELLKDLRQFQHKGPVYVSQLMSDQMSFDSSLLSGMDSDSQLFQSVSELKHISRYEKVLDLVRKKIVPLAKGKARLRCLLMKQGLSVISIDDELGGLSPDKVIPDGDTDFEVSINDLARSSEAYLGGLVLLSDGRQTAGGDPAPALKSLSIRGVKF
ncbi:MAG: hypothetical protein JXR97_06010, partial [Planctomycetes bacterium]|nr:hypothetical protein [Planctomycetota bacterium]